MASVTNGDGTISYGGMTDDQAMKRAQQLADRHGEDMTLVDSTGEWIVHPAREDGSREPATEGGAS